MHLRPVNKASAKPVNAKNLNPITIGLALRAFHALDCKEAEVLAHSIEGSAFGVGAAPRTSAAKR